MRRHIVSVTYKPDPLKSLLWATWCVFNITISKTIVIKRFPFAPSPIATPAPYPILVGGLGVHHPTNGVCRLHSGAGVSDLAFGVPYHGRHAGKGDKSLRREKWCAVIGADGLECWKRLRILRLLEARRPSFDAFGDPQDCVGP